MSQPEIAKLFNKRSCERNDEGECMYYGLMCNEIPKTWDECIRQQVKRDMKREKKFFQKISKIRE